MEQLLADLFVEEWSIAMNYSQYVTACAPSICTYTETKKINISYTVTLLLGLYSGLTILLRLLAPFLVEIYSKCGCCPITIGLRPSAFMKKMKRLNLFKSVDKRTPADVRLQRITSHIYLALLAGMTVFFLREVRTGGCYTLQRSLVYFEKHHQLSEVREKGMITDYSFDRLTPFSTAHFIFLR